MPSLLAHGALGFGLGWAFFGNMRLRMLIAVLICAGVQDLDTIGRTGATLAIHLSVRNLKHIREKLAPHYGEECPVVVVYRATWPDQLILRGTLSDIAGKVREAKITRTALVLVGTVLGAHEFRDSALYDAAHEHVLRNRKTG